MAIAKKGIREFANHVPKDARVIMFFNFHGDLTDVVHTDTTGEEEVFILWTEDKPFTMLSAIALKEWITAEELRGMIDAVHAKEIVIAIDSCHSGGGAPDILKKHGRHEDWQGREAVMMSSKANQFSYFTVDGLHGVFTFYLSEALRSGFPTLKSAFEDAAKETSRYVEIHEEKCANMLWEMLHKRLACVQTPEAYDPTNLLPSIELNAKESSQ